MLTSGGGRKQIASLYCNYGGSRKTISSAFGNIGGSRKQIFPYSYTTVYTYHWDIYTVTTSTAWTLGACDETYTSSNPFEIVASYIYIGSSYRIDEDGEYHLDGGSYREIREQDVANGEDCTIYAGEWFYFHFAKITDINNAGNISLGSGDRFCYAVTNVHLYIGEASYNPIGFDGQIKIYKSGATQGTIKEKGSYYSYTSSTNRNAYPDNGISGSYWYVYTGYSE